jgi:sigma-B regulation protein RsbU (phosphoserine phosphatase)
MNPDPQIILPGDGRRASAITPEFAALAAMDDLAAMLAGNTEVQTILDTVARKVCEVLGLQFSAIRLLNPDTGELVIRAVHNLSDLYLSKGPVVLDNSPIDAAAFAGETVYVPDMRSDPRVRYPDQARQEGLVSGLCVPLVYRARTVGVIRVYSDAPRIFTDFEVALLRSMASQAAAAIINARLYAERLEAKIMRRHFEYAAEIQRRMLPCNPPAHRRVQFGCVYEPSLKVGGDFYDFLELPWGNVGAVIADVSGKGVPAALLMASVRAALRAHAHSIFDINEIVGHVNRHLCRDTAINEFATLFYGVFSPDGTQLTYCNAGHDPPLVLRGIDVFRLETGGMAIGVFPAEMYQKDVVDLKPGDILAFYTDGVVDVMNFNDEKFGRQRLAESMKRYRDADARIIARQILWDVRRFAGLTERPDDLTLVVAKVI